MALNGGINILKQSKEMVILCEASLFRFYKSDKIKIDSLIKFFDSINYEIYDIYGASYRPIDNAMAQIDIVFCHKESILNSSNIYANTEMRKQHNDNYYKKHKKIGAL